MRKKSETLVVALRVKGLKIFTFKEYGGIFKGVPCVFKVRTLLGKLHCTKEHDPFPLTNL